MWKRCNRALVPFILTAWLIVGCVGLPANSVLAPAAEDLAVYHKALAPGQRSLLDELPPFPEYKIQVEIDPEEQELHGQMTLELPADDSVPPLQDYYFRLYPNLDHFHGSMDIDLVAINSQAAPYSFNTSDTAIHVAVPTDAIKPGKPITFSINWRANVQSVPSHIYSLFGQGEGVMSLPLFYPVLAVQDEDSPSGWNLGVGLPRGDAAFTEMALYQVKVVVPQNYVVVGTGSLIDLHDWQGDDAVDDEGEETPSEVLREWTLVSPPAREFALFVSDQFRLVETFANDVRINSWHLSGDEITGRAAAEYTAAALRIYQEIFGPYPYAELDVVPGPMGVHGMEYPGLFELGVGLYRERAGDMESRIAHEVAHQWWYNLVGNDPVNVPWLDEGLAEFSTYFYREKIRGEKSAEWLAENRWWAAYEYAIERGEDAVVNQPAEAFGSNYETMIYGKAALYHYALLKVLGEQRYLELLRRYLDENRYQVATPQDFQSLAEEFAGSDAVEIYERWIESAEDPTPTPTPTPTPQADAEDGQQPPETPETPDDAATPSP
ncbi:MAG: M1 family metallopeptidase [Chloroflexota bacterium]|nr:M1 family metallopeptidase [Chloroflexota bacterium]